ncbi:hypothetical protein AB838_18090 [Rhodobacteraceae bacterium (ex Bugula neritina AB1)]|nr:hypothetical protein AB838_18090 [Rhodobacteraceae bacterium (ex Bugula neritina AB1)]
MAYQDVPTFSNDVRKELPKVILVVRPKVEELPDVIGQFSFNPAASPPLLRRPLVELIQRDYPGCCEFIQAGKIWDDVFKRELDGSQYFFSNVVKTIDSWDPDLSDVRQLSRKDGSVYFALAGSGVLNAEAVNGAHIWRDAKTMHVLCSEEFREKAEAVGASNMHFYRVDVSA